MGNIEDLVYSKEVIEFTAVANEYCNLLEKSGEMNGVQILKIMQRILPLLYIKTVMLPNVETSSREELENFVTEEDWKKLYKSILPKLGEANDYPEVFSGSTDSDGDELLGNISENLSDIYQDLKNFLLRYRIGTTGIMNDAVWEVNESFRLYWGQKLVNTLSAVHNALEEPELIGRMKETIGYDPENIDTSNWIITKRQENIDDDEEEIQG